MDGLDFPESSTSRRDVSPAEATPAANRPVAPPATALPVAMMSAFTPSPVTGELVALVDDGHAALIALSSEPSGTLLRARSVVALHANHIGASVLLVFESGDAAKPIVIGVLSGGTGWPLPDRPAEVAVEADGERMVVTARQQLVLRCGKASITLTAAGKILLDGTYVASCSTGVNVIRGGSIQLN